MERSQVSLRVQAGSVVGSPGPRMSGQWSGTDMDIIPNLSLGKEIWSPAGTPRS